MEMERVAEAQGIGEAGSPHPSPPPGGEGTTSEGAMQKPFACTMLLARRLYPEARRFGLGALAAFHDLSFSSRAHRAMADAEVAALLLARIQRDLERRWDVFDCTHELLVKVQKAPKAKVPHAIRKHLEGMQRAERGIEVSQDAVLDAEARAA